MLAVDRADLSGDCPAPQNQGAPPLSPCLFDEFEGCCPFFWLSVESSNVSCCASLPFAVRRATGANGSVFTVGGVIVERRLSDPKADISNRSKNRPLLADLGLSPRTVAQALELSKPPRAGRARRRADRCRDPHEPPQRTRESTLAARLRPPFTSRPGRRARCRPESAMAWRARHWATARASGGRKDMLAWARQSRLAWNAQTYRTACIRSSSPAPSDASWATASRRGDLVFPLVLRVPVRKRQTFGQQAVQPARDQCLAALILHGGKNTTSEDYCQEQKENIHQNLKDPPRPCRSWARPGTAARRRRLRRTGSPGQAK
jgi:hypothetical protein